MQNRMRFPSWLKRRIPEVSTHETRTVLHRCETNTVCESARCPNQSECFADKKATFMILGTICTRNCAFCAVDHGNPQPVPFDEPERIAEAVERLGLEHVVITSVTRDDLSDGGAHQFAYTVKAIKERTPQVTVEVLIPDFEGNRESLAIVCETEIDILNHNMETVRRLYSEVRPQADYERSRELLRYVRTQYPHILTKTGFMVGIGETDEEVIGALDEVREIEADIITIGQYLQPRNGKRPVFRFVSPETFQRFEVYAQGIGIRYAFCGPYVRSSYQAQHVLEAIRQAGKETNI